MNRNQLLKRIKSNLRAVYDDRLRGIVLYGSEARGEAAPESDIDLLVLLDGPVVLGQELEIIIRALYPLQLEIDRPIHVSPVNADTYWAGEFALYRNVKKEGIWA